MAKARMLKVEITWKDGKETAFEINTATYAYTINEDYFVTVLKDDTDVVCGIVNLKETRSIRTRLVER